MTEKEKNRVRHLCYTCKKGYKPTPEEMEFLSNISRKFPDEYEKIQIIAARRATGEVNPLQDC